MGFEVLASQEFTARLDEAIAHGVDNYGLRSARKLVDSVYSTRSLLAGSPLMGALVDGDVQTLDERVLRWVRIDSYVAIYRVDTNVQVVTLLTLFYATSNWRRRVLKWRE